MSATNLQLHEVREAMDAGMPRNSAQLSAQMVDAPSVLTGRLKPDGTVLNENGVVAATKCAVEPVWFLPGIAKRFGLEEATLRRMLFEHTGGMFPELVTRTDLSVFLPPIGGCTAYIFGDPATIPDESKPLTVRSALRLVACASSTPNLPRATPLLHRHLLRCASTTSATAPTCSAPTSARAART